MPAAEGVPNETPEEAAWAREAFEKLKGAELKPCADGVSENGAEVAAAGAAVELPSCAATPDAAGAEAGFAAACRNQVCSVKG